MKKIKEEQGNSLVYILWLLSVCGIIVLIVVNISRVYLVKQQADTATQQAALAGTSVLLEATDEAVKEFDMDPLKSAVQLLVDGKSVSALLEEKKQEHIQNGNNEQTARIKAYNEVLPSRIAGYPELRETFSDKFKSSQLAGELSSVVSYILSENGALVETSKIELSDVDWRIEIQAEASFSTLTDGKYLAQFTSEIPRKAVGPKLTYLEVVY